MSIVSKQRWPFFRYLLYDTRSWELGMPFSHLICDCCMRDGNSIKYCYHWWSWYIAQPHHPLLNMPDLLLHGLTWVAGLPLVSTMTATWFPTLPPGQFASAACLHVGLFFFKFLVVQSCVWLLKNASSLSKCSIAIDPAGIVLVTCPL